MTDPLSVKRDDIENVTATWNNGILTFEFRHSDGMDEFSVAAPSGGSEEAIKLIRTWQEEAAPDQD